MSICSYTIYLKKNNKEDYFMKKIYSIEVDCAACALKIEEAVKKIAGVSNAAVGFVTQKMKIEFEDDADIESVMKEVIKKSKRIESDFEIFI